MTERVLVLPRTDVPGGTGFRGVRPRTGVGLEELRRAVRQHGVYLERSVAESEPSYKQLIPYVVVRNGPRVFRMERTDAGGDVRLHGKASIGVGGHLNPVDDGEDALMTGLRREWTEEIEADWEPEFRLVGLLNDETTPVGAVHLGVVFEVQAYGRPMQVREREKLEGAFVTVEELASTWERLETWSQLVAEAFGWAAPPPKPADAAPPS